MKVIKMLRSNNHFKVVVVIIIIKTQKGTDHMYVRVLVIPTQVQALMFSVVQNSRKSSNSRMDPEA